MTNTKWFRKRLTDYQLSLLKKLDDKTPLHPSSDVFRSCPSRVEKAFIAMGKWGGVTKSREGFCITDNGREMIDSAERAYSE
ncbi:hypothetical protein ACWWT1_003666 [Escherichia coli]|nr:hypothetical protein [Escherichia coli]EGV2260121.1 hypothetical protein [Escherichia coli]EHU9774834.1 hypothetical protein [Escherichia coli]ELS5716683.1 hypothetical protein [Escherichia coli]ELX9807998.1 hypothetical protein [Escherichia coli]